LGRRRGLARLASRRWRTLGLPRRWRPPLERTWQSSSWQHGCRAARRRHESRRDWRPRWRRPYGWRSWRWWSWRRWSWRRPSSLSTNLICNQSGSPEFSGLPFTISPALIYREGVHLEAGRELQADPENEMGPNLFSVSLTLDDEILHGLGCADARRYVRIVIGDISAGRHPRPDGILRVFHG